MGESNKASIDAVTEIKKLLEECRKLSEENLCASDFVSLTIRMAQMHAEKYLNTNS